MAAEKLTIEKIELIDNLKKHITFLASDSLEGRRTGTIGEKLAMNYLVNQYKLIGLESTTTNYIQKFLNNEGKIFNDQTTFFKINSNHLKLNEDFFPLAFSANSKTSSKATVALKESNEIWFCDVSKELEENKTNTHFDINEYIKKAATKAANQNASGLVFFNSTNTEDNISFLKKDRSNIVTIPVVYITNQAFQKYFNDSIITYDINLKIELTESLREVNNVVGYIDNNAKNTIILGAHYDHLGFGEDKNALDNNHAVHNGADDNASGSAALIELAKILKHSNNKNNNYLIIHFSGEELGLLGSKYWLENPTKNIIPNYMINMDMIGRYDTSHKLTIGGFGTSPIWGEILPTLSSSIVSKFDSTGSGPSDHASFYRKDIPVLFFFTGSHSDYHKTTDDVDKINFEGEYEIIKLILKIIATTDSKNKLEFTKTRETSTGKSNKFNVSLGVIPDYGYSGIGVKIDGVSSGKIAEKIGLLAGDILIQLGDYKITDMISYMQTLGKFKKLDKTILKIIRKEKEFEFEILF